MKKGCFLSLILVSMLSIIFMGNSHNGLENKTLIINNTNKEEAMEIAHFADAKLTMSFSEEYAVIEDSEKSLSEIISAYPDYKEKIHYQNGGIYPSVSETEEIEISYQEIINYDAVASSVRYTSTPLIAIIDTGIDIDHPDFDSSIISPLSYNVSEKVTVSEGGLEVIDDKVGHGTEVAGIMAASHDNQGINGVCGKPKLLIIKLTQNEKGGFDDGDIILAIDYAVENGAKLINMSFSSVGYEYNPFADVLRRARKNDVICVAASGNDGTVALSYPAADPNVIGVGSVDNITLELASYSNYGENIDVVAPGTYLTTSLHGGYKIVSGTSYSAPVVTSLLALGLGKENYKDFYLETSDGEIPIGLYSACTDLGEKGKDLYYGYGLIDALSLIKNRTSYITFETGTTDTIYQNVYVCNDKTIQYLPTPERIYHTFDGWYYDIDLVMPFNLNQDYLSSNVKLYAKWITERDDKILYEYNILDNKSIEITGYLGQYDKITIPQVIDGKVVTRIADKAFEYSFIQSITIPETITSIGKNAFYNSNISEVIIKGDLEIIEEYAFSGCYYLKEIDLPDSIYQIDQFAFANSAITEIKLPESLTKIDKSLFANCYNLKSLHIGSKVEEIVIYYFVQTLMGPQLVISFTCPNLEKIVVNPDNKNFHSEDGILFNKTHSKVLLVPQNVNFTSYKFDDSIKIVGEYAFYKSQIADIYFNNVLYLKRGAFMESNIAKVTISKDLSIEQDIFSNCMNMKEVVFDEGVSKVPSSLFREAKIKKLYLPSTLKVIQDGAFKDCLELEEVVCDNENLTTIGDDAFANCSKLKSFNFANLLFIGANAFANCESLTTINLTEGLTTIGDYAFSRITLKSFTIPNSVTDLGKNILYGAPYLEDINYSGNGNYTTIDGVLYNKDLTEIISYPANKSRYEYTIPSSVSIIGARAFAYSQNLSSLYVTDAVTIIDDEAFYRSSVSNLTLISKGEYGFDEYTTRLPKYLEYLGDYAFYESNIRTICENSYGSSYQPLPDTITYFGEMAFAYSKVEVVALPASMTVVPDGLFSKCSSLKTIIFNDQLEEIGDYAFEETSITGLSFPTSLKKIGKRAFIGCTQLNYVDLANVETIGKESFYNCSNLKSINIPANVTNIEGGAFYKCSNITQVTFEDSNKNLQIQASAFAGTGLKQVVIPKRLINIAANVFSTVKNITFAKDSKITEIEGSVFAGYPNLESVVFEEGSNLKELKANAFERVTKLKTIDLRNTKLTYIGETAFKFCYALEEVLLPETLLSISKQAFYGDEKLTELFLPKSLDLIGPYAFYGCKDLTIYFSNAQLGTNFKENWDYSIKGYELNVGEIIEDNNFRFALTNDGNYSIIKYLGQDKVIDLNQLDKNIVSILPGAFNDKEIDKLVLPEGMQLIAANTFENSLIKQISIPNSLEIISRDAFRNSEIQKVIFGSNSKLQKIESNAFRECNNLEEITLPKSLISIYNHAFFDSSINKVIIPSDSKLEMISNYAFAYSDLTNITLPNSLKEIGYGAFRDCKDLTEVVFGNGELTIQNEAFYNTSLEEVYIPAGINYIGDYAFTGIPTLKAFSVDKNNQHFSSDADGILLNKDQTILISVPSTKTGDYVILQTVEVINTSAFENSQFTNVSFAPGSTISVISNRAFFGSNITSMHIPNTITIIDVFAFAYCDRLEEVSFEEGSSLYQVNEGAFYGCVELKEIYLPQTCVEVGAYAFYSCGYLTEDVIKYSKVNEIGKYAFANTNIKTLDLKIIKIDEYAFSNCLNLEEITINGYENKYNQILENAFYGCNNLKKAYFGSEIDFIGKEFFELPELEEVEIAEENVYYSSIDNIVYFNNEVYFFYRYAQELIIPADKVIEAYIPLNFNIIKRLSNLTKVTIEGEIPTEYLFAFIGLPSIKEVYLNETANEWVKRHGQFYVNNNYDDVKIYLKNSNDDYTTTPDLYYNFAMEYEIDDYILEHINYNMYFQFTYEEWKNTQIRNNYYLMRNCANLYFIDENGEYQLLDEVVIGENETFANQFCNIDSLYKVTIYGIHHNLFTQCNNVVEVIVENSDIESLFSYQVPTSIQKIRYISSEIPGGDARFAEEVYVGKDINFISNHGNQLRVKNLYYAGSLMDWLNLEHQNNKKIDNLYIYENGEYQLLKNIKITEDIETIKPYTFNGISSIENIEILGNVSVIKCNAFLCPNLKEIIISDKVGMIEEYSIIGEYFNATVPFIVEQMFGDSTIKELTITGSIELHPAISSAEKLFLPQNIKSVPNHIFDEQRVKEIYYNGSIIDWLKVKRVGSSYMTMTDFYYLENGEYVLLEELEINGDENSFSNYQFANIKSLKKIKINGTSQCGYDCFYYSNNITEAEIYSTSDKKLSDYFSSEVALTKLTIGGIINSGFADFNNSNNPVKIEEIIINKDVNIALTAFYEMSSIKKVVISENATGIIGLGAFSDCINLEEVVIASGNVELGNSIFSGCITLSKVMLADDIKKIPNNAFANCVNLVNLDIPTSVESFSVTAVSGTQITKVELHEGVKELFIDVNPQIESITIPKSVTTIKGGNYFAKEATKTIKYNGTINDWCNIEFESMYANPLYYGAKLFIDDKLVTELDADGFDVCNYAFINYQYLERVTIKCNRVGQNSFQNTGIKELIFDSPSLSIGKNSFAEILLIEKVVLTENVTEVPYAYNAFMNTTINELHNYTDLVLSINYSSIYDPCNYRYQYDKNGVLVESGIIVDDFMFIKEYDYVYLLGYLGTDNKVTLPQDFNGQAYYVDKLLSNDKVEELSLPQGMVILQNAFTNLNNLKKVTISKNTTLHSDAFLDCHNLEEVYFDGDLAAWLELQFSESANPMFYAEKLYYKNNNEFVLLEEDLIIPDGVTRIKSYAFNNLTSIKRVHIPTSVTSIEYFAFAGCNLIEEITIPNSVTSISNNAFYGCSNINKLTLPGAVVNTSNIRDIFGNDNNIREIYVTNCDSLKNMAFAYLDSLEKITIEGSLLSLPSYAFQNDKKLTSVNLPDTLTEIESSAFTNCLSLEHISLPNNLKTLGYYAFDNCPKLTQLVIPDSVESYSNLSDSITELTVPFVIEESTGTMYGFRYPAQLKKLIVTKQEEFGGHSIEELLNLEYLELQNAKTISSYAITDCPSLTKIILSDNLESFDYQAIICRNIIFEEIDDCYYISSPSYPKLIFKGSKVKYLEELDLSETRFVHASNQALTINNLYLNNKVKCIHSIYSIGFMVNNFYLDGTVEDFFGIELLYSKFNDINPTLLHVGNKDEGYKVINDLYCTSEFKNIRNIDNITIKNQYISADVTKTHINAPNVYFEGTVAQWCELDITYELVDKLYFKQEDGSYNLLGAKLVIPEGVTVIKYNTFFPFFIYNLTLPSTLKEIENLAFRYGVEQITNNSDLVIEIGSDAHSGIGAYANYINNKGTITTRDNTINSGDFCFEIRDGVYYLIGYYGDSECVIFPDTINGENYIVSDCCDLEYVKELVVPNVLGMEYSAFYLCENLEKLTIPYLGINSNNSCSLEQLFGSYGVDYKLQELIITHDKVFSQNNISKDAFRYLFKITVPKTVEKVTGFSKNSAERVEITNLSNVVITNKYMNNGQSNLFYIDDFVFIKVDDEYDLIGYIGDGGVINFPETDFRYNICSQAITIDIADGINIEGINFSSSVKTIAINFFYQYGAFENFSIIDRIVIPETVETVEDINYCHEVIIKAPITNLDHCFNSSYIEKVTLPNTIKTIKSSFNGSNLESITFDKGTKLESITSSFTKSKLCLDDANYIDGCLYLANALISINSECKYYVLPEDYIISSSAFEYADNLIYYEGIITGKLPENLKYLKIIKSLNKSVSINDNIEILILPKEFLDISSIGYLNPQEMYVDHPKDALIWDTERPTWKDSCDKLVYEAFYEIIYFDENGNFIDFDVLEENEIIKTPIFKPENNEIYSYNFVGWDFDSDGIVDVIPATIAKDTKAVAILEEKYTEYQVNYYDKDGKTLIDSQIYHYNDELKPIDNPTKKGYAFIGWKDLEENVLITSDMNLYSVWEHQGEHNYIIEGYINPTCYDDGGKVLICDICDEYIITEVVSKTGHVFLDEIIAPNCYDRGYTIHTCDECGYQYKDSYIDKKGHQMSEWEEITIPTCATYGSKIAHCLECNFTIQEEIHPLGHSFEVSLVRESTCRVKGIEEYRCTVCYESYQVLKEELEHTYYQKPLTFIELSVIREHYKYIYIYSENNILYLNICIDCMHIEKWSDTYSGVYLSSAGCTHELNDWQYKINTTCQNDGIKEQTCKLCKQVINLEFENKVDHLIVSFEALNPTCTKSGHNAYEKCSYCDYTTYEEIAPLGHEVIKHEGVIPTCTEAGYNAYEECERCDYTTYQEIAPLGHELLSHDAIAPTCIDHGWDEYEECLRCDYSTYLEIPAIGHNYSKCENVFTGIHQFTCENDSNHTYSEECSYTEWIIITEATEFSNGSRKHSCVFCNDEVIEEIPMLHEHIYSEEFTIDVAPSCLYSGEKSRHCINGECAAKVDIIIIDAFGHDLVKYEAKEVTCEEDGHNAYEECLRCDYTTRIDYEAFGHDYEKTVYEVTCESDGYTLNVCNNCGDSYTDEIIVALGHDFIDYHQAPTASVEGVDGEKCNNCGLLKDCVYTPSYNTQYIDYVSALVKIKDGQELYTALKEGEYLYSLTDKTNNKVNNARIKHQSLYNEFSSLITNVNEDNTNALILSSNLVLNFVKITGILALALLILKKYLTRG